MPVVSTYSFTYTLPLLIPFFLGNTLTQYPGFEPGSVNALIAGVALGLISALAILLLVLFNTRALAERLMQREPSQPPRLRFVRESRSRSKAP